MTLPAAHDFTYLPRIASRRGATRCNASQRNVLICPMTLPAAHDFTYLPRIASRRDASHRNATQRNATFFFPIRS